MKKKLIVKTGATVVFCGILFGVVSCNIANVWASTQEGFSRKEVVGFNAVPGAPMLEIRRDAISNQLVKGSDDLTLAKYTLTNNGPLEIQVASPRFYAMTDNMGAYSKV